MSDFCYLPVELKGREFLGKLLLACNILNRGKPVLIGKRIPASHPALKDKKATVLMKSAALVDNPGVAGYIGGGHDLYSLDEEGLLMLSLETFVNKRFTAENIAVLKSVLCWGDSQSEALKARYPDWAEKFIVSGNPRAELWANKNFGLYDDLISDIHAKYGDYILFASTFPVSSPFAKEGIVERLDKFGYVKTEQERQAAAAVQLKLVRMRNAFASVIKKFLELSDVTIVVRPHPSEDISFWSEFFGDNKSVVVTNEHSISPWALGAKAVLHNSCTTAVEAGLYGVPTIAYTPSGEAHDYEVNLGNLSSYQSDDEGEILAFLKSAISGELHPLPASEKLQQYLMEPTGTCDRIADLITGEIAHSPASISRHHVSIAKGWIRWMQTTLDKRGFKVASNDIKYSNRKFPFTRTREVERVVNQISARHFPSLKCEVVKVDTNLFYLIPR